MDSLREPPPKRQTAIASSCHVYLCRVLPYHSVQYCHLRDIGGINSPWTYTQGMVSNIFPLKSQRPVFQTQIPLNPGNSGGPIVDSRGVAVGVVTSGISAANNVNFAIHASRALTSFKRLDKHCACLIVSAPKHAEVFHNGNFVGQGPRVVIPVKPGKHIVSAVVAGEFRKQTVRYPQTKKIVFKN